jgi:iron complex outermembrane recepter protein
MKILKKNHEIRKHKLIRHGVAAVMGALLCLSGVVTGRAGEVADLTALPIEELLKIEITSVSRKPQALSNAAAAVFLITQEDIRLSGATSIPEVLRMVPGLEVARIDASKWAVSSRGFNGRYANKLLVLIDGRTVYNPLFSGVLWDAQDTVLEDIDRIEVIRGPGAALWGANAVNGVINIITRSAKETVGGLATGGGGTVQRGFGEARYGAKLAEETYGRVYLKYFDRGRGLDESGHPANDGWNTVRAGFRLDSRPSPRDALTFQGDLYRDGNGQTLTFPQLRPPYLRTFDNGGENSGANLLGRWQHTFSDTSQGQVQIYYDRAETDDAISRTEVDTLDIDLQQRFSLGKRHEVVAGMGYRYTRDHIRNSFAVSFAPREQTNHLFSAFLQDDITLVQDRLRFTVGSKFEVNSYTGFEVQPNARLLWTPDSSHSVWASVSRAVRTPSRGEETSRINATVVPPGSPLNPSPLPVLVSFFGNDRFKSEELWAYEMGYRVQASSRLNVDVASFYNVYDQLRSVEPGSPGVEFSPIPPHYLVPLEARNLFKGHTYGVELAADWRACDRARLRLAYTYLQMNLQPKSGSNDTTTKAEEGKNPHHQVSLRVSLDLRKDLELNLWLRWIDRLPSFGISQYTTLDARLAWKPVKNLEISLVGQNLFERRHMEFKPESFVSFLPTEVERGVYGKVTWRF